MTFREELMKLLSKTEYAALNLEPIVDRMINELRIELQRNSVPPPPNEVIRVEPLANEAGYNGGSIMVPRSKLQGSSKAPVKGNVSGNATPTKALKELKKIGKAMADKAAKEIIKAGKPKKKKAAKKRKSKKQP